jgi:type IX secretion system PorP/SprF family membrane protein
MNMLKKSIILAIGVLLTGSVGSAQDAHLSQFDANTMLISPSMTGMFDHAEFRMTTNFRSQWGTLTNDFLTTGLAFDMPINERYGAGVYMLNYDMAGVVNSFTLGFSGAYNIADPSADFLLTAGIQAGLIHKKINASDLIFDNQYSDGFFDSDLPSRENFEKGGKLMPDVGLGFGYTSVDPSKKFNPFFNFGSYHLTTPNEVIIGNVESQLPIRYSLNGGTLIELTQKLYLKTMALYQRQGNDSELNIGILGDYDIEGSSYNAIFGAGLRLKDSFTAQIGIKHGRSMYRISYDVNTSALSEFTNKRGAIEFSIIYFGNHKGAKSDSGNGPRF